MPYGLTTLKDRAIQYKSGALLTQLYFCSENSESEHNSWKMLKQNATPLRTTPEPEDADRRTKCGAAVPGWGSWAADTESIKVSAFQLNQAKFGLKKAYITILRRVLVAFGNWSDSGALPE